MEIRTLLRRAALIMGQTGLSQYEGEVLAKMRGRTERLCPCCDYRGIFRAFGHPPRYDAVCRKCGSFERQRLLRLAHDRLGLFKKGDRLLHFAPEPSIGNWLRDLGVDYFSADLLPGRADRVLNIEAIAEPEGSYDAVLASHVLEHVNDGRALGEIFRILKSGGLGVFMIPIVEGWDSTYENSAVREDATRELHFGQHDHVRFFGRDFRDRVQDAGFELDEFVATGDEAVRYSLIRGERVFIARKR